MGVLLLWSEWQTVIFMCNVLCAFILKVRQANPKSLYLAGLVIKHLFAWLSPVLSSPRSQKEKKNTSSHKNGDSLECPGLWVDGLQEYFDISVCFSVVGWCLEEQSTGKLSSWTKVSSFHWWPSSHRLQQNPPAVHRGMMRGNTTVSDCPQGNKMYEDYLPLWWVSD